MKQGLNIVLLLLSAGVALVASAGSVVEVLPPALEKHLDEDVPYWLNEPRLHARLRESNAASAVLDEAALAALEKRWQAEMDAGAGDLGNRVASRFPSKYFAEVLLRMDGAYRQIVAVDNRGVLVAASELPDRYRFDDQPLLRALATQPGAKWLRDETLPAGSVWRFAFPVVDPLNGERLGSVLLEIDASRLQRRGGLREGSTRLAPAAK